MRKLIFISFLCSILLLTKISAMEPSSSLNTIPKELQSAILETRGQKQELNLNYIDIISCMQINKSFNELTKKGTLWVLLSNQDGFICHQNTAFKCHYNYLKGLKFNQRNPEFKDTVLLEESILCFNKAAPFMHEGAIHELRDLMNSPHVPLETKCIYLPEEWDIETCALLSEDQILDKSDENFLELLCESNFFAIHNSKKIAERLYAILNQKELSILSELLALSALSEEKGDELQMEIQVLLTNFDKRMPHILTILEQAKEDRDFIILDLLIYLLDMVKDINENSDDSSCSNSDTDSAIDVYIISPLLDDIKKFILLNMSPSQMSKMSTFLEIIADNDLYNEWDARKTGRSNDIPSPYREALLSIFRSGNIKPCHFLINKLSWNINLYNSNIVTPNEALWNYFYFIEKEIIIKYPSIICYDFVLPELSAFAWGTLDDDSSPLYKRQFLILQNMHKMDAGNIICPDLIDDLLHFDSFNFSPDFWKKYLSVNNYNEFKNDLFKSILPKLLNLSEIIKNGYELAEIYNLLITIYLDSNNQTEAIVYAEKILQLDLKRKLYNTTIVSNVFSVFLKAGEFEKAEETLDFLPNGCDQEKQNLRTELNYVRNAQ